MAQRTKNRKWVAQVKTDSTHPPAGLFKKNASTIARSLASRRVSPMGPQFGMRMLNYFIKQPELWKHTQEAKVTEGREESLFQMLHVIAITLVAFAMAPAVA
jgi:hypothetical protein